jgi:S-adenosylmethionine:tRNA ribosyltransferase-isomerase
VAIASCLESDGPFWSGPLDYHLPAELIAQRPAAAREDARLLVVDRDGRELVHSSFAELPTWLRRGDLLIANDTRVMTARLLGRKESGGRLEALVLACGSGGSVPAMIRSSKPPRPGQRLIFEEAYDAVVVGPVVDGRCHLDFGPVPVATVLERVGRVPLPPYIRRDPDDVDRERYQTVFARESGSVAAPTAGLHFGKAALAALAAAGVGLEAITLHVGPGTFAPIRGDVAQHEMEPEHCEVTRGTAEAINRARAAGGRCVAVGTTTVRALETAGAATVTAEPYAAPTGLFIRPGHRFRVVDALITNFHLPGSTLLCLVMALAGEDLIRTAYQEAVSRGYRFYSYGDAMLII